MAAETQHDARGVARQFQFHGEFVGAVPYGAGHINDTYRVEMVRDGISTRYILQRISREVFKNPIALMENVRRVTEHLECKFAGTPGIGRTVLRLIPTARGGFWHRDERGDYWRAFAFIEGARGYDVAQSEQHAFEAARAFGRFQTRLSDLPGPRLHETIPDFHHTPKRFAALEQAVAADAAGRAGAARSEIEFALSRRRLAGALLEAGLPERVIHNDTKLNNVLLDESTGEGLCVIDLDTVMPGLAPYDFGDLVRSAASSAPEDEREVSKVHLRFPMFVALARGYLAGAGAWLTRDEKRCLAPAAKVMAFELGMRFLADHLAGDAYFKARRAGHNLDRARAQFKLVESIEAQEARMRSVVEAEG